MIINNLVKKYYTERQKSLSIFGISKKHVSIHSIVNSNAQITYPSSNSYSLLTSIVKNATRYNVKLLDYNSKVSSISNFCDIVEGQDKNGHHIVFKRIKRKLLKGGSYD